MNRPGTPPSAGAYDVVIVGGGMVGSMLACALGGSSLKVAVLDRSQAPPTINADYDLRVSALTLASHTIFDALGIWSGIARRRFGRVSAMRVWESPGKGEICFDAVEIGEPYLAFIIENSVILAGLQERLHHYTNIHSLNGVAGDLVRNEDGCVIQVGERALHARLVVAADGAESVIRERLQVPLRALDLRQQGIVTSVRTERPHNDIAWQRFLPSGPLAFLPLSEPHAASIVWSADDAYAQHLLALDDQGFSAALAQAFGDRLGSIVSVGARAAFPLALAQAERYVEERIALVGDAAHTVHPLAGQGVNLGFLDAAALAEVLLAAVAERRDIGRLHVLRRYERWRKGENLAMIGVTGAFKFLFGNDWPLLRQLRNIGLSGADHMTMAKRLIMRRACGLSGDLPRLARRTSAEASTLT